VQNIDIQGVNNQDGTQSKYIRARVNFKNDDLKLVLLENPEKVGIVGKDGIKVANKNDLKDYVLLKKNLDEPSKKQNEAKELKRDTPKKSYKKKEKPIPTKEIEIER